MSADINVLVPQPQAPCQDCVENAVHQDETFGLVWCEHTRYGGVYLVEQGQWSIVGPFDDEVQFRRSVYNSFAQKLMRQRSVLQ